LSAKHGQSANPKRPALQSPHGDPTRFAGRITVEDPHSPLRRWTLPAVPTRPLETDRDVPRIRLGAALKPEKGMKDLPRETTRDRSGHGDPSHKVPKRRG
jgi:hypothetical protein